jgi:hypothetical protein
VLALADTEFQRAREASTQLLLEDVASWALDLD